jgi:hypothetical protein
MIAVCFTCHSSNYEGSEARREIAAYQSGPQLTMERRRVANDLGLRDADAFTFKDVCAALFTRVRQSDECSDRFAMPLSTLSRG